MTPPLNRLGIAGQRNNLRASECAQKMPDEQIVHLNDHQGGFRGLGVEFKAPSRPRSIMAISVLHALPDNRACNTDWRDGKVDAIEGRCAVVIAVPVERPSLSGPQLAGWPRSDGLRRERLASWGAKRHKMHMPRAIHPLSLLSHCASQNARAWMPYGIHTATARVVLQVCALDLAVRVVRALALTTRTIHPINQFKPTDNMHLYYLTDFAREAYARTGRAKHIEGRIFPSALSHCARSSKPISHTWAARPQKSLQDPAPRPFPALDLKAPPWAISARNRAHWQPWSEPQPGPMPLLGLDTQLCYGYTIATYQCYGVEERGCNSTT